MKLQTSVKVSSRILAFEHKELEGITPSLSICMISKNVLCATSFPCLSGNTLITRVFYIQTQLI